MSQYALVINYENCTGCHTCEVACRQEKGLPVDQWGIKVLEEGPKQIEGKWEWNYIPVRSWVCDFCTDRIQAGKKAACEHHCLAQCIEVVSADQMHKALESMEGNSAAFVS